MTENKILKSLEKLLDKLGDITYANFTDKWGFKINDKDELVRSVVVREEFKLSDMIEQFKNKVGCYNSLRLTDEYRKFEKEITNPNFETHTKDKFYQDTYDEYMEEWQKRHPGEDYKEWADKIKKRNLQAMDDFLARTAGLYLRPYQEMEELFGPVTLKKF